MTCIHYITTERKKKSKNIKIDIKKKLIGDSIKKEKEIKKKKSRKYIEWLIASNG